MPPMSLIGVAAAAALAGPPAAPVMGCDDRIIGAHREYPDGRRVADRFDIHPRRDRVIGPLAFSDLRTVASRRAWKRMAVADQWLKSIPLLRPGRRVTVVVPARQRRWMRLTWGDGERVTMQACNKGEGRSGASGNTAWSGGFEIDYAEAPQQGRCARIIVWIDGRRLVRRLVAPRVPSCGD